MLFRALWNLIRPSFFTFFHSLFVLTILQHLLLLRYLFLYCLVFHLQSPQSSFNSSYFLLSLIYSYPFSFLGLLLLICFLFTLLVVPTHVFSFQVDDSAAANLGCRIFRPILARSCTSMALGRCRVHILDGRCTGRTSRPPNHGDICPTATDKTANDQVGNVV